MNYVKPEMEVMEFNHIKTDIIDASVPTTQGGEPPVNPDIDLGFN